MTRSLHTLVAGCVITFTLAHCTPKPAPTSTSDVVGTKTSAPSAVVGVSADPPFASSSASVPVASAPVASVAVTAEPAKVAGTCDNDRVDKTVNCSLMPRLLGDCGAMAHYSCPKEEKRLPGMSFRAGTAARIGNCYLAAGQADGDCKKWEACVRSGIGDSCAVEDDRAWCKKNLPACDPERQELCAKILSSMEPGLHDEAIRNIKQLNGANLKKTCRLTWDFNGFPFCPFCAFGQ